jgi:uncharacterized protein with PQ loop repeat
MADIYLDPMIIIIAVTIVVSVIGIFDFLPQRRESKSKNTEKIK